MTARDQWQILQYCDASWPFSPCFLLTLRNPFFSECLAFIATPSLQYLMLPNQTAENGQVVFSQEKAQKWCQLSKRKELSIKEAEKAAKHQIKDAIAVSNFFFLMHALNLLCLKRKIRDCSQPICYVWLSDMEQL